jgi:carbonic anhydrase/acetyltransferase-like protein (isoleucine patch superfamily)
LIFLTPHPGGATAPKESSFIDPSATIECGEPFKPCSFGSRVYIGPFATLKAGPNSRAKTPSITIGNDSNVQDNALLDATNRQPITLGEKVIIAHGAAVYGGAKIGVDGTCPPAPLVCASFVGFNSEIAEGAIVERNAMVLHLARVGPGVRIPSGKVVMSGKNVTSDAQIPDKTMDITTGDQMFMEGVINVNLALAAGYIALEQKDPTNVCGVNYNPETDWTRTSILPSFAGKPRRFPNSPHRIIGDVRLADKALPKMGMNIALRADEGTPFVVGTIFSVADFTTFHALRDTQLNLGNDGKYGVGSLVHGGKDKLTSTGRNFELGNDSVFYNSTAGDNCHIGPMSLVEKTNLGADTDIPAKTVVLAGERTAVEWERRPHQKTKNIRGRCKG